MAMAPAEVHTVVALVVAALALLAVVLADRALHRRARRCRHAGRAAHDARLRAMTPAEVDTAFDRLVQLLR